jgi:cyclase
VNRCPAREAITAQYIWTRETSVLAIRAAIAAISPLPIKYLINTHFHGDHTGGNEAFQKDGAIVVAQDNIRVRLAAGTTNGSGGG